MAALDFPILREGRVAYLDNAATSLMPAEVIDAMREYECGYRSNVARGIYPWAERATAAYERSRAAVARAIGADPQEIVFTSGTTAALNMAAAFVAQLAPKGGRVLVSELEHHSNVVPWILSADRGFAVEWAGCDGEGALRHGELLRRLAGGDAAAVAVSHASNVTGTVNDVAAICAAARAAATLSVVDGAQYVPHAFPCMDEVGADFYAFSGHKCNGPMGVGVLWCRKDLLDRLQPVWGGGGMVGVVDVDGRTASYLDPPHRFEAGTPPIAAAIGLGAAVDWRMELEAGSVWDETRTRLEAIDRRIKETLASMEGIMLYGSPAAAGGVPITAFNVAGCHPHDVCQILGEEGVCTRGGHHCAQPLMRRLDIDACVRASLGPHVSGEDADRLLEAVAGVAERLG